MKNKIEWCNLTFNPVWGCRNNCPYCYARVIAKRFWKQRYREERDYYLKSHPSWFWTGEYLPGLKDFKPTWLKKQFNKKLPTKPQRIFVGSMSEIYYWREEWIERVIEKVEQYPQHTFMFLTKYPQVYSDWVWPKNCWLGVTMTGNKSVYPICKGLLNKVRFLSIEPLLEKIDIGNIDDFLPDWIIVGAETGNRKEKVIPKKDWLDVINDFCNRTNTPLYIKDNISYLKGYEEYRGVKEFPTINKL